MKSTIDDLLNRSSIRDFSVEAISDEAYELLKQVALAAPTAMNRQSHHFTFITNRDCMAKIETIMQAFKQSHPGTGSRPRLFHDPALVVLISVDKEDPYGDINAGIAAENLAIGAKGLNLGSCIIGSAHYIFDDARELLSELGIPEDYRFAIAVSIGHIATPKQPHVSDLRKINEIK